MLNKQMLVKDRSLQRLLATVVPAAAVAALVAAGCTSTVSSYGDKDPGATPGGGASNGSPGTGARTGTGATTGAGSTTGAGATTGTGAATGAGATTGTGATSGGAAPVVGDTNTPYVRLTRDEYQATVKAAFNVVADVSGVPTDGRVGTFTSNVSVQDPAAEMLLVSEDLAALIVPKTLPACSGAAATCITTSYQAPIERLFRRPLTAAEVTKFGNIITTLVGAGVSAEAATRGMLVSALMSPDFLFRATFTSGDPARGRRLAEHLSYAMVDAPPDAALTTAGKGDAATLGMRLKEQAVRLGTDARAVPVLARFLAQWLLVDVDNRLDESADFATSPVYLELIALAKNALATNVSVKSLVNSTQGFIQKGNFAAYGIAAQSSTDDVAKVNWSATSRRGILGEELFLDSTRHPDAGRRPIYRGHMIRTSLLCQVIPSPPPNSVDLNGEVTDRTTDSRCGSCHSLMDPIGKAFAAMDLDNKAAVPAPVVNGTGEISGMFKDLPTLMDAIAGSDTFANCFSRNMLAFFLEQNPEVVDGAAVGDIAAVVKAGGGLADVLAQVVVSVDQRSRTAIPWCTGQ